ncbi:hypothetical protein EDC01DRAFT_732893 [Geopyxis carbonaria]|nr:hypothetical protein EDC01DRAFT_732893 [Geopyxis carbonaria]
MRNLNIFLVFSALLVCILATPTPRDPAPVSLDPTGFRTSAGNDNATNARAPPSDDDKYVAGWAIISPGDPGYAAAAANLAVHDASASRGSLKCETTHSSPIVNDVHMVGQILARKPKAVLCMNTNGTYTPVPAWQWS